MQWYQKKNEEKHGGLIDKTKEENKNLKVLKKQLLK